MKGVLTFDGACRGNPGGKSAGGAVLKIQANGALAPVYVPVVILGTVFSGSNNEAEYQGLLIGLREALYLGVTDIEIYGDSKLVVMQVQRQWKCQKPHLKILRDEARALLFDFHSWTISWIPREKNTEADAASNEAIDNPKKALA